MGCAEVEAVLPLLVLAPCVIEGTGLVAGVLPPVGWAVGVGEFPDGLLGEVGKPSVEPETGALVGPMAETRTR